MKVTTNELRREASKILAECRSIAPDAFDGRPAISFEFSSRMTRAAGKARPASGRVTLSVAFFEDRQNFEKDFRNTVTHEIAHVLSPPVRVGRKRSSHGPAWKAMHRRLGGTGERCHELDLAEGYTRRVSPRTPAKCGCGCGTPISLGPTQARKARAGVTYYIRGHYAKRHRGGPPSLSDMLGF